MINKIKVKSFEVWDAETGEADIVALFENNKSLKAFTLDHFEQNEETEVLVSLFCNEYELKSESTLQLIENIEDKFSAKVQGQIIEIKSDEEVGNVLVVDAGGIFVNVYVPNEEIELKDNQKFFIGSGRLDIETELIT